MNYSENKIENKNKKKENTRIMIYGFCNPDKQFGWIKNAVLHYLNVFYNMVSKE